MHTSVDIIYIRVTLYELKIKVYSTASLIASLAVVAGMKKRALNPGPPALDASTVPLGYRGGGSYY